MAASRLIAPLRRPSRRLVLAAMRRMVPWRSSGIVVDLDLVPEIAYRDSYLGPMTYATAVESLAQ
jgi:hypothetical protein